MDSNDKTPEQKLKDAAEKFLLERLPLSSRGLGLMCNVKYARDIMVEYCQSQSSEIEKLKEENKLLLQREIAAQDKKLELIETLKNERAASNFLLDKLKAEISSLKFQLEAKDKLLDETEAYLTKDIEAKRNQNTP